MPVSLSVWRVRIGTFVRRKELENNNNFYLMRFSSSNKKAKGAPEQSKENQGVNCHISSCNGSAPHLNSPAGSTATQHQSPDSANPSSARKASACGLKTIRVYAYFQSQTPSQSAIWDNAGERGSTCEVKTLNSNNVTEFQYSCVDASIHSTEKDVTGSPDVADTQPWEDDELDCRYITIDPAQPANSCNTVQSSRAEPVVSTSATYSEAAVAIADEPHRIEHDKLKMSSSVSFKEGTEHQRSNNSPALRACSTNDKADVVRKNPRLDMTKELLLRCGDIEENPGPNTNPGQLKEMELHLLADGVDPSDFMKIGLALGFTEAQLTRFKRDNIGSILHATYKMLYEWLKTVRETEAREKLSNNLQAINLVQLADSVRTGMVGDHILSLTEEEVRRVIQEVKEYSLIHHCQIQASPLNSEYLLPFDRMFTNLTLMEEDKKTTNKAPVLYEDLLKIKVNGIFPKRLLVEGEGGVGKTTLCAKIVRDWIHGAGYQDFKLVLLVLLREVKYKTVGEIIKSYLPDDNTVTAMQLDKHVFSHQKDVFLVLDGLDELVGDLINPHQIALIILNRLFMSGKVLITSRRWRSDEIRMNAYLRNIYAFIALEGFSADDLSSYVTRFFYSDPNSSEDLNQFISNNDVIRENMAPFPIFTTMLCVMWKDFDGERRQAMFKLQRLSQLIKEMVLFLVDHYLSKIDMAASDIGREMDSKYKEILYHLSNIGCLALQGLHERRLVFTEQEFLSWPGSVDMGCRVGVLTKQTRIPSRRERRYRSIAEEYSVQFPHKLFQEYLAGMYLTSLYNTNISEYDKLVKDIIDRAWEFRELLYFTSAQQKEVALHIVSHLTRHQRMDNDFIVDVAYESQDLTVAKAVADHLSTTSSKTVTITTGMNAHTVSAHTFFMYHREVDTLNIEKSCGWIASEDLAEFMCFSHTLKTFNYSTAMKSRIHGTTMHDVFYSVLARNAHHSKIETANIDFGGEPLGQSASKHLAKFLCSLPCLTSLTLTRGDMLNDAFFTELASFADSSKIERVNIDFGQEALDPSADKHSVETASTDLGYDDTLGQSASKHLAKFLCSLPCLTNLTLKGCDVLDDAFFTEIASLAESSKIETANIDFGHEALGQSARKHLAQFLCSLPCLTSLSLTRGDMLDDVFFAELASFADSSKIHTADIDLGNFKPLGTSGSKHLARFLCCLLSLRNLTIPETDRLHDDFLTELKSLGAFTKIPYFIRRKPINTLEEFFRLEKPFAGQSTSPELPDPSKGDKSESDPMKLSGTDQPAPIQSSSEQEHGAVAVATITDKFRRQEEPTAEKFDTLLPSFSSSANVQSSMHQALVEDNDVSMPSASGISSSQKQTDVHTTYHAHADNVFASGRFDEYGGELSVKFYGFRLIIPPGALEKDEEIKLRVLTEIPDDLTLQEDEIFVSHGFKLYPSGLQFKRRAKLIMPHCAVVTIPNNIQTALYSWNRSGQSHAATSSQTQQVSPPGRKGTSESDEPKERDFEDILETVARNLSSDQDIHDLGKALDFGPHDINRYIEENRKGKGVSHMGTLSMLQDWKKKQPKPTAVKNLQDALKKAGQIRLATDPELFGEELCPPNDTL